MILKKYKHFISLLFTFLIKLYFLKLLLIGSGNIVEYKQAYMLFYYI